MKLYGQVTRISDTIFIPAKEGKEPMQKKILCIEEIDDDKEVLDRVAVDFLGDKMDLIADLKIGTVVWINFHMVYNAYTDGKIYNSIRGWKVVIDPNKFIAPKTPSPKDEEDIPF